MAESDIFMCPNIDPNSLEEQARINKILDGLQESDETNSELESIRRKMEADLLGKTEDKQRLNSHEGIKDIYPEDPMAWKKKSKEHHDTPESYREAMLDQIIHSVEAGIRVISDNFCESVYFNLRDGVVVGVQRFKEVRHPAMSIIIDNWPQ